MFKNIFRKHVKTTKRNPIYPINLCCKATVIYFFFFLPHYIYCLNFNYLFGLWPHLMNHLSAPSSSLCLLLASRCSIFHVWCFRAGLWYGSAVKCCSCEEKHSRMCSSRGWRLWLLLGYESTLRIEYTLCCQFTVHTVLWLHGLC